MCTVSEPKDSECNFSQHTKLTFHMHVYISPEMIFLSYFTSNLGNAQCFSPSEL